MFLMNYLFDFNLLTGVFRGDRRQPPGQPPPPLRSELFTSVNWLKLVPTLAVPEPGPFSPFPPPPGVFDPEPATWDDQLDMDSGTLLLPSTPAPAPDENNVGVRIGLDPDSSATAGLAAAPPLITLSVCFGKPAQRRQGRASPFYAPAGVTPPNQQIVQTTFVFVNQARTGTDAEGNPTWFFPIGQVRHRPTAKRHRTHRYEFSVGIIVNNAGVAHHYSHDPDMDIGL